MRLTSCLTLLLLALPAAQAGDDTLAGNWKITILEDGQQLTFWMLKLDTRDGKLTGTVEGLRRVPPPTLENLKLDGDKLSFTIHFTFISAQGRKVKQVLPFECQLPKAGAKKIYGSVPWDRQITPVQMEYTTAKNALEVDKELVTKAPNDPRVFGTVAELIGQASEKKIAVKDVQEWVETALKSAERYGSRFTQETALRLGEMLLEQEAYAGVAVLCAKTAEKIKGGGDNTLRSLTLLSSSLHKAGLADQAKEVDARLDKIEIQAHAAHLKEVLPFKVEKFAGRKGSSKRTVLVELFTGAQCPPCVGADLAFDALAKTYQPIEVMLLQYHLHIPGPDALTNVDTENREKFYNRGKSDQKTIAGTPTILFNGKAAPLGGGDVDSAQDLYKEYRKIIDPLLENPAAVNLQASAVRKGDKINIKASALGVEKPGEKTRLRLALVEEWVRYKGGNGLPYHSRVVRAFPGGHAGLALTKKDNEQTATVDLAELRKGLTKYLDDYAKNEDPFPDAQRPLAFRNLRVVAFVQDDATNEVLQATETPVRDE